MHKNGSERLANEIGKIVQEEMGREYIERSKEVSGIKEDLEAAQWAIENLFHTLKAIEKSKGSPPDYVEVVLWNTVLRAYKQFKTEECINEQKKTNLE